MRFATRMSYFSMVSTKIESQQTYKDQPPVYIASHNTLRTITALNNLALNTSYHAHP
ncbi:hypothetical protein Syn6312_3338 [Synechococcus sp. PCC 6312]|nr:hypothetical protein Syn6312_3338 [Synechococcus sp. PCC 6312]